MSQNGSKIANFQSGWTTFWIIDEIVAPPPLPRGGVIFFINRNFDHMKYFFYFRKLQEKCSSENFFFCDLDQKQKFSSDLKLSRSRFWAHSNFITFESNLLGGEIWLGGSMEFKKSPSTHVCNRRFRLQRRMTFPFVLADRYDPKEAYKHTF